MGLVGASCSVIVFDGRKRNRSLPRRLGVFLRVEMEIKYSSPITHPTVFVVKVKKPEPAKGSRRPSAIARRKVSEMEDRMTKHREVGGDDMGRAFSVFMTDEYNP